MVHGQLELHSQGLQPHARVGIPQPGRRVEGGGQVADLLEQRQQVARDVPPAVLEPADDDRGNRRPQPHQEPEKTPPCAARLGHRERVEQRFGRRRSDPRGKTIERLEVRRIWFARRRTTPCVPPAPILSAAMLVVGISSGPRSCSTRPSETTRSTASSTGGASMSSSSPMAAIARAPSGRPPRRAPRRAASLSPCAAGPRRMRRGEVLQAPPVEQLAHLRRAASAWGRASIEPASAWAANFESMRTSAWEMVCLELAAAA